MEYDMTLVSIALPVHNGENFVREALDSILNQTYTNFELVISDNASSDMTEQICREYAATDKRIRYFRQETNIGAAPNHNFVFQQSKGEYFKWASHDDVLMPTFLEKCVNFLEQNPSYVLASTKVKVCDAQMNFIENYDYDLKTDSDHITKRFKYQIRGHQCYEVFGVIRRDALLRTPLVGSYFAGDAVLLLRLVLLGPIHEIPEYLFLSRRHPNQSEQYRFDVRKWSEWFDSSHRDRKLLPYWKLLSEYFKTLGMYPLTWRQRTICFGYILYWMMQRRRHLERDIVVSLLSSYKK